MCSFCACARQIKLANALQGAAIPLHAGARRYYEEVGLDTSAVPLPAEAPPIPGESPVDGTQTEQ